MEAVENAITEPTRVKNFANFFKNYMSIWSVVVAALPIPVTAANLIPVFEFQKHVFSTYTTLFCFLLLGFIFYSRHWLAKYFFPDYYFEKQKLKHLDFAEVPDTGVVTNGISTHQRQRNEILNWLERKQHGIKARAIIVDMLPLVFIVLAVCAAFMYNKEMESVLSSLGSTSRSELLKTEHLRSEDSTILLVEYLCIFVFAEAAFIFMAIKEYLQDLLHISDDALMVRVFKEFEKKETTPPGAAEG